MYIISSSCYFLQVLFFMLTIQILVSRSDLDLDFLVFFLCLSFSWSPVLWYLRKYFGLEIIRLWITIYQVLYIYSCIKIWDAHNKTSWIKASIRHTMIYFKWWFWLVVPSNVLPTSMRTHTRSKRSLYRTDTHTLALCYKVGRACLLSFNTWTNIISGVSFIVIIFVTQIGVYIFIWFVLYKYMTVLGV